MRVLPYDRKAYDLLHNGAIALAQVEANGMRIDEGYLVDAIDKTRRKIARKKKRMERSEVMAEWKKTFRGKVNLESNAQLGKVLFEVMGFEAPGLTKGGQYSTSESSLSKVDHPFVRLLLGKRKLEKALKTYLLGIQKHVQDGFVHPVFNLHTVATYRSSSDSPNFHNFPKRNKKIMQLVRRAILARKKWRIVEVDISGAEVCTAACYHKDPVMLEYLHDTTTDMHRDMAMECYLLAKSQVTSDARYCAKNKFVFPEFYGDWYKDCARHLWHAIDDLGLKTADGTPLKAHLRKKGINSLGACDPSEKPRRGTFEYHIMQVENKFWKVRFKVYDAWKRRWWDDYQEKGWFKTKTGFICQGAMKRNEAINYPVQGAAFHLLLWVLTELVNHELRRRGLRALIIGQIHDSIVADVPEEEVLEFLAVVRDAFARLEEHWDWIIVPLVIEAEVSPVGGSWADKEEIEIPT